MIRRKLLALLARIPAAKAVWGVLCPEQDDFVEFSFTRPKTGKVYKKRYSMPYGRLDKPDWQQVCQERFQDFEKLLASDGVVVIT